MTVYEMKAGESVEWKGLRFEAPLDGVYATRTVMRPDPETGRMIPYEEIDRIGPLPERK